MRRFLFLGGTLGLLAALPPRAAAQDPSIVVTIDAQTARVQTSDLLTNGKYVDLMRSGFPMRLHFRLELWRVRSNWFDQFVRGVEWDEVARHDPLAEEFVLIRAGGKLSRYTSPEELARALNLPYRIPLTPPGDGKFYLVCRLVMTTLNDTDLEELTQWLRGDASPAVQGEENIGKALARGAERAMVRIAGLPDLTLEARSKQFRF
ncbi:MAG TPA: DUF4390 domain-containing protein [Gemmatimonadales bacterium]|nr:DUF4390 domain-containing protein [Gemmatimonadales bacterium]